MKPIPVFLHTPKGVYAVTGTLGYSFKRFERQVQANLVANNLLNDRSVTYTARRSARGTATTARPPHARAGPEHDWLKQPISFNLRFGIKV